MQNLSPRMEDKRGMVAEFNKLMNKYQGSNGILDLSAATLLPDKQEINISTAESPNANQEEEKVSIENKALK